MTFVVDSDNNVSPVLHDLVFHLAGQVEDGVLVGLDGLGGVNDENERGVQRSIRGLAESALRRLRASLAPGGQCLVIHLDHHKMSKHLHIGSRDHHQDNHDHQDNHLQPTQRSPSAQKELGSAASVMGGEDDVHDEDDDGQDHDDEENELSMCRSSSTSYQS